MKQLVKVLHETHSPFSTSRLFQVSDGTRIAYAAFPLCRTEDLKTQRLVAEPPAKKAKQDYYGPLSNGDTTNHNGNAINGDGGHDHTNGDKSEPKEETVDP